LAASYWLRRLMPVVTVLFSLPNVTLQPDFVLMYCCAGLLKLSVKNVPNCCSMTAIFWSLAAV